MHKLDKPGLGATAGLWGRWVTRGVAPLNAATVRIEPNACCRRRRPANSGGARTPGSDPAPQQHPGSTPRARRRCPVARPERDGGGASWAGGARAGGGIPAPGAGHPEARADLRSGDRGDWLARQARAPPVLTGGRLRPARPSPPCKVGGATAPRGAGPPPGPRLCRRAGNFPAKVILQARPRPRSGGFRVGWTATSGLLGLLVSPGRWVVAAPGASLPAPARVSFHDAQLWGGDRPALPSSHPQVNWAALALLSRAAWSAVAMGTAGTQMWQA